MDADPYKIAFGKRLRSRREELHITQEELGNKLGYSKSFISKVEKGEHEIPQSKVVLAATALRTTKEYLMGWILDPNVQIQLDNSERMLINYYRSMNSDGKSVLLKTAQGLADSGAYSEDTDLSAIS